jgi:hypothetical protein
LGDCRRSGEQLAADLVAEADALEHPRPELFDEWTDQLVELGDLVGQGEDAPCEACERDRAVSAPR